ncbi:MAG: ABC transporter permease [Spirochaetes bacterium]|nr:ABC transporter permease [Spirochaetota bacterium]
MIELKNVSKIYDTGKVKVRALEDVSLKIEPGEFIAIMGPSGSGKSTLLHILGFLDKPDSGSYFLLDRDITDFSDDELSVLRNRTAGFIFQQFHLLSRISALGNAELPLIYAGKSTKEHHAPERLNDVGLSRRMEHYPNELSGGEQQRVAIARSLVNDPLIIFADEPTGNLDSKSEQEIISILKKLNEQGKTIIMVTHEDDVARNVKRIIRMRDGRIISDKKISGKKIIKRQGESGIFDFKASTGQAKYFDYLKQAVNSIVGHKLRSFLSILGILIGVASVISMLALGSGAQESISKDMSSLGSNLLIIRPGSFRHRGVALESGSITRFSMEDAKRIEEISQIKKVSPTVTDRCQIVYKAKNWNTLVQGTGTGYETMHSATPVAGRFFTEQELKARKKVVLLGTTVVTQLFENTNPVGKVVKINKINFQVTGVLPSKGSSFMRDQDDVVVIPVTTAMYRLLGKKYVDMLEAEVKDQSLIESATKSINAMIRKIHRIRPDEEDSFEVRDMTEIRNMISSTTKTFTWLLGSVAFISLLVGGIGIMNIMLVSVKERTREIGLRKAIGARKNDILNQFLIESALMTLAGGLAGILLGALISFILSSVAGWATKISFMSVMLSTLFSVIVGISFGLWPAIQASKLNPVEALRYE